MEIPEGNEDEPLSLAGKLRKVPEAFERFVSATTRQYVGHVLGLVKSFWPSTPLDALGKGAKFDCTDDQFSQYLRETSMVANQIVESLNKPESPWTLNVIFVWRMCHKYFEQVLNICVISSTLFDGRIVQSFDVSSNCTREFWVLAASCLLNCDSRYEELYP